MSDKISRNAPCPCGSGKKYKHCCIGTSVVSEKLKHDLAAAMQEYGPLETFEQAQQFAQHFMKQRNEVAVEDFHGLTSSQMHHLLHGPFGEGSVLALAVNVRHDSSPMMKLSRMLATALGDKGVKATATGNLPRALCRDITYQYLGEEEYARRTRFGDIQSEPDAYELHKTRIMAEIAMLIELERGRWRLTDQGRAYLLDDRQGFCYPYLVTNSFLNFNWAYEDRYDEYEIIQRSIGFTLYLLHLYGNTARPAQFYADALIRAFPAGLSPVPPIYGSPEDDFSGCYFVRCLDRILAYTGLVTVEGRGNYGQILSTSLVCRTDAFARLVEYRGERPMNVRPLN